MYVFGEIDKSSTIVESNTVNYTQNLSDNSSGVQSVKIVKDSINTNYWNSLNVMFYTSGSSVYGNEHKFGRPSSNLSIQPTTGEQFLTKYHGYPSSSIITISSQYYGEKIKEGSFRYTDLNNSSSIDNTIKTIIKDDGFGNLYSTNAYHSQSAGALSSSDNYVGNIFYDLGVFSIVETGSFDGTNKYSDVTSGNFSITYKGVHEISTYEYVCNAASSEFNMTQNESIFKSNSAGKLKDQLTGSLFPTFITEVGLFDGDENLIGIAKLSKPIRKSQKIPMRFFVRMDY